MKRMMVKKRLLDGRDCEKCLHAEELLRQRGAWEQIDQVIIAEEGNETSEGMVLAGRYGVEVAPFFVVQSDDGSEQIYRSVLQFLREQFPDTPSESIRESVVLSAESLAVLEQAYASRPPLEIITWALQTFGQECAIAFSGAEDVVLIEMAVRTGYPFSVFCLDTGRLHPETYQFLERVRKYYGIEISLMAPDTSALQALVKKKGLFSFYTDGHKECCGIRKVEPLKRALRSYRAWITGQRRDQSPSTRGEVLVIHPDEAFVGKEGLLVKINPLAGWTSAKVWGYIRAQELPYNPLHDRGFVSIGCEPCTRPPRPGEHERAGRWWWEEETKRECGLHIAETPTTTAS